MQFPKLKTKALLSPMVDINDIAFRLLCKKYGCELTYTQMISTTSIVRQDPSFLKTMDLIPEEKPYAIQLFGQDPDEIVKAALFMEEKYQPSVIDLNMGCPAHRIVKQGAGSALLIKPQKVAEIVKKVSSKLNTPFTVKIRLGEDEKKIVALDVAKICEQNGAAALAVHGRTVKQGYSGKSDWSMIKLVKDSVSIPVIGNGDIVTPLDAKRMLDETGCDYFMIARGAMKMPFIFRQVNQYLSTGKYDEFTSIEKKKMILSYFELAQKHNVEFERVKVHSQHFTVGEEGGGKLRDQITHSKSIDEIRKILKY